MIYPLFYTAFACRASACRHTCCRGWEIRIDPAAAEKYDALPGALGDALRCATARDAEGAFFRLTENGDCPFLRPDGLCRLIAEGGKDLLCGICAAHPRFFGRVRGTDVCGLGLSCEAACALLLRAEPLLFADSGTGTLLTPAALLRRLAPELRREERTFVPALTPRRLTALGDLLARCEPIDGAWPGQVRAVLGDARKAAADGRAYWERCDRAFFRRLYVYVLYRSLTVCGTARDAAAFARAHVTFILLRAAATGDPAESARRWSEAIEYSDVNAALLPKN